MKIQNSIQINNSPQKIRRNKQYQRNSRCSSLLSSFFLSPLPLFPSMETISLTPLLNPKLTASKSLSHHLPKSISCSLNKRTPATLSKPNRSWITHLQHGLAAAAISLAVNFSPVVPTVQSPALASEFDVLNGGPPTETYVVDDAGVLSRVTKSDLKRLLSDLESRKNLHINFITIRKLTVHTYKLLFLAI